MTNADKSLWQGSCHLRYKPHFDIKAVIDQTQTRLLLSERYRLTFNLILVTKKYKSSRLQHCIYFVNHIGSLSPSKPFSV